MVKFDEAVVVVDVCWISLTTGYNVDDVGRKKVSRKRYFLIFSPEQSESIR